MQTEAELLRQGDNQVIKTGKSMQFLYTASFSDYKLLFLTTKAPSVKLIRSACWRVWYR